MRKKIGTILILLFMAGILSGCDDHEELKKRISEAEQKLVLAEQRAEMAEKRAEMAEKQRDEVKQKALKLGYKEEDWK